MSEQVIKTVIYGEGGHDSSKPNNNISEIIYYTDEELAELTAKQQEKEAKEAARQAVLEKLGLTADEIAALIG